MKKVVIFLSLLRLCACGGPDYLVFGVPVYIEEGIYVDRLEIIDAVNYFIDELVEETEYSRPELENIFKFLAAISFQSDYLNTVEVQGGTAYVVGLYSPGWDPTIRLTNNECIAKVSLFHELLHHYLWHLITPGDTGCKHIGQWWEWLEEVKSRYKTC